MNNRKSGVFWLTGLSGAGKTSIAHEFATLCKKNGIYPILLDGDQIRNITEQTGFDETSRKAHNLRIGRMAALFEQQGHLVIVSMISPYKDIRQAIREQCECYVEIFIDTPLTVCIQRDPKGLYQKALNKQILEFTGISAPYEKPENPEIHIDAAINNVNVCAGFLWEYYLGLLK